MKSIELFQWDSNKKIPCSFPEAHFACIGSKDALIVKVVGGNAQIPNILLQEGKDIMFWFMENGAVADSGRIRIITRAKPADYIYTETEAITFESLVAKVEDVIAKGNAATNSATTAAQKADAAANKANAASDKAAQVEAEIKASEARRVEAEQGRAEAEATRAANETKRTESFNTNLVSWNGKVDAACKKATDTASKAAQDAKTATDAAIAKTEEATQAAVAKAQTATDNATAAANKAEAAVSKLPLPLGNVLKGEAESTFINLHDSWKAPILNGKVLGQSNQLTTKGINLLPNCEAKETKDFPWGLHPTTPLTFQTPLPTGQYTVSIECAKSVNFYYKEPGNTGTSSSSYSTVSITAKDGNRMKATFTADKPIGALYFYYASEGKYSIARAQIEAGAKATAYEPYTGGKPSPSPEYPQEITNLNKAEIIVSGKNLLEQPKRFYNCVYAQGKPSAYTSSMVTLPFTTQAETNGIGFTFDMTQGATYTVSIVNAPKFTYSLRVGQYKQQEDIYSHANLIAPHIETNQKPSLAFTAVDNGVALVMLGGKWTNGNTNVGTIEADIRFQVEVGNKQTSYEPHKSKSTPIDLQGNELCSLPNGVKDEVVIDAEGNVSLIKRTKQHDWNCTQIIKGTGRNYAVDKVLDIGANYTGLVAEKAINAVNNTIGICYVNQKMIYVTVPESVATKEQANQLYGGMKVIYQLAEPQIIPLGKVELPALPEATSNVWNDGNIPANVYINYLKDVNIAYTDLENQIKQITAALSMIDTPTVIPEMAWGTPAAI